MIIIQSGGEFNPDPNQDSKHTIVIILADKYAGQAPQLGHVEGLEDLALIGGAVSVEGHADAPVPSILMGEGNTGTEWDLGPDNAIAAVELVAVHVHGAALATTTSRLEAHQFGHHIEEGYSHQVGPGVAAVCRYYGIAFPEALHHSDGHRLLAIVEMAEAPDGPFLVLGVSLHLEASHL